MRARTLGAIVAICALAAVAALLSSRGERSRDAEPRRTERPEPAPPPPPALAEGRSPPDVPPSEPPRPTTAPVPGGGAVAGRVASEDGTPVRGVEVTATPWPDLGEPARAATTDEAGRYRLVAKPGTVRVGARGRGWIARGTTDPPSPEDDASVVDVVAGGTVTVDLVVVRGAEATGRVVGPDGRGVAQATVTVRPAPPSRGEFARFARMLGSMRPARTTPTDASGVYRIDALAPGSAYEISVWSPAFLPAREGPFDAVAIAPIRADFALEAGRWIDVTVRGEGGAPVAEARVVAVPSGIVDAFGLRPHDAWRWRTDAEGKARVGPFPEDVVEVTASADGYLDSSEGSAGAAIEVPPGRSSAHFVLERGGFVSGRVVDEAGRPVPDIPVQALRRTVGDDGHSIHGFESTETASDGTFRIDGLPAGRLRIQAGAWDAPPSRSAAADVEIGATRIVLTLGSHPEGEVRTIRVVDPKGHPVPRARLETKTGGQSIEVEQGLARLHVDDLWNGFSVSAPRDSEGRPLPFVSATVEKTDRSSAEIVVRLQAERPIAGRVLGPDGAGVPRVRAKARAAKGEGSGDARTDAKGFFRIVGISDGAFEVSLEVPPSYVEPSSVVVIGGTQDVRFDLRLGVQPTVRVLDEAGNPLAGASVRTTRNEVGFGAQLARVLMDELGRTLGTDRDPWTSEDGTRRLGTLDPQATYTLSVGPPAARADLSAATLEAWRPADVTVRLSRGLRVRGRVERSGAPLGGAVVRVSSAKDRPPIHAGDDGTFEIRDLPPGPVRLAAAARGQPRHFGPDVLVEAGAQDVVLTVEPGVDLVVRVANPPAMGNVWVALRGPEDDGPVDSVPADAEGWVEFGGARPGATYSLWATTAEVSPPLALWQEGVRWTAGEVRVTLLPTKPTRGRVVLPPRATPDLLVVTRRGMPVHFDSLAADGRFEVALPDGSWTFSATAHDEAGLQWVGAADAVAGDASVEIRLEPAPPEDD